MGREVRYQHRRGCDLITPFGTVTLDHEGYVTDLNGIHKKKLLNLPGFVDAEVFGEEEKPRPTRPDTRTKSPIPEEDFEQESGADETNTIQDTQYWELIKELTNNGAAINSEGYISMEALNPAIRQKGWPVISGTRRIKLTDEGRKIDTEGKK